jgi:hypothetical protein
MKITRKDLLTWVREKTPVRYRGDIYHANYNGLRYFLRPITGGDCIDFYKIGRGIYGLVTNKKTV